MAGTRSRGRPTKITEELVKTITEYILKSDHFGIEMNQNPHLNTTQQNHQKNPPEKRGYWICLMK